MATQTVSQTPEFYNQITLLAQAARIAGDVWRGSVDFELERRIRSTPPREACRIVFELEALATALETQMTDDAGGALVEACEIILAVARKKPVLTDRRRLMKIRSQLAIILANEFVKPSILAALESSKRLTQNNEIIITELLTAACRGAAEAAAGTALEEQYLALALALGTDSPAEKNEIIRLFIQPTPAGSVDSARQEWGERITGAIAALVEWRAALLSEQPSLAALSLGLEEIEAAGLLDWLEGTGNIDQLFEAAAAGGC